MFEFDAKFLDKFWLTFIAQTIVGSSQVFILGIPPRLAAVWFGPEQVSTACAAGVFGNQVHIQQYISNRTHFF